MSGLPDVTPVQAAVGAAWVAALCLILRERRRPHGLVLPLVALGALAMVVAATPLGGAFAAPLVAGLAIATLAREPGHTLESECAIKLLWVFGVALALSFAGEWLLTLATATERVEEQWIVLSFGLASRFAWSAAVVLSLAAGMVLLGGAPFHAWVADVLQGARAWNGPLALVALQASGAAWLLRRLVGVAQFPDALALVDGLLTWGAVAAFLAGAAALTGQRRPERRVGTLASLNGGLVLALLAAAPGEPPTRAWLAAWAAHLVCALAGAATLARFLPVPVALPGPAATLFRRHPLAGALGLVSLLSLAGAPGTPGSLLWLAVARRLIDAREPVVLLALVAAWFAAFATAMALLRDAFGVQAPSVPLARVPGTARAALAAAAAGIAGLAFAWWRHGAPTP